MTTDNNIQQSPYLRSQRDFSTDDVQLLSIELDKSYIDIAYKVNDRIIGNFSENVSIVTGESWYFDGSNQEQSTIRRVYTFSGAGTIKHFLDFNFISGFTRIYGSFTDNENITLGNWYTLPYVDTVAVTNQVSVSITPTNIVITAGAGAPTIFGGIIVLEWLSNI